MIIFFSRLGKSVMSYSSLQEAYNIPAFASNSANRSPPRGFYGASAGTGTGTGAGAAAGYGGYEPDRGQEFAAYGPGPVNVRAAPPRPPPLSARGPGGAATEGFLAPAGAGSGSCPNTRGRYLDPPSAMGVRDRMTYGGQLQDYHAYCKSNGICNPVLEGFENHAPAQRAPPSTCAPLSPPPYVYPMNPEDKRAYTRALDAALADSPQRAPFHKTPPRPRVNMDHIQGYEDDEFDRWMSVSQVSATPNVLPAMNVLPPGAFEGPYAAPSSRTYQTVEGQSRPDALAGPATPPMPTAGAPLSAATTTTPGPIQWMDALVFMAAGLLFIFLLDQLFKIAMNVGMRRTLVLMDRMLERAIVGMRAA